MANSNKDKIEVLVTKANWQFVGLYGNVAIACKELNVNVNDIYRNFRKETLKPYSHSKSGYVFKGYIPIRSKPCMK